MFKLIVFFLLFFTPFLVTGQNDHGRVVVSNENRVNLRTISTREAQDYQDKREEVLIFARENRLPLREVLPDGTVIELQYIGDDGVPVYYQTFNAGAAVTTGAAKLHPLGNMRLFLTGNGITAGVWDEGRSDGSHPEYGGRLNVKDVAKPVSNHAMHVAGSIIAKGIDERAKGMAYEASAFGYDWDNDLSEMATEAAEGLLFSNHSYGIRLGWGRDSSGDWTWYGHADSTHDYRFGYYSNKSRRLDEITFNAPYYTIVWAAGNDRNDVGDGTRDPDGPFKSIGPEAVAKNVIAVGAVSKISSGYKSPSDVRMSNFSSWGPTDDGRIKPDFVAPGVSIFSTISNNSYASYQGTSMASPVATGSMMLLQQLYAQENEGHYMRSSTLKALIVNSVNNAGVSKGPDYSYGWGLLSVDNAAATILNKDNSRVFISELELIEDFQYELEFEVDGMGAVVATIAWTDPEASPTNYSLDPFRLMLINDLDLRIFGPGDAEYLPWILDPFNPEGEAEGGDNFRDNVEKILIEDPVPGNYRLVVTHKGNLQNGSQDFSLVLQTGDIHTQKSFYWIGGGGDWEDPSNWSLSSGGSSANEIPGINDHVVFDINSFNANNQTIRINSAAECYSFNWHETNSAVLNFNSNSLTVATSVYSDNNRLTMTGNGTIIFNGTRSNNFIRFPSMSAQTVNLIFDKADAVWVIDSPIDVNEIKLLSGSVVVNSETIKVRRLIADGDENAFLDLSGVEIEGLRHVEFAGSRLNYNLSKAIFKFSGVAGTDTRLIANGIDFYEVNNVTGRLIIDGDNILETLINSDKLTIAGDNRIYSLYLTEGSELNLSAGSTQLIRDNITAFGTESNPVRISNSGSVTAFLHSDSGVKFCLEYLIVENVSVSGTSVFNSGTNSIISPNSEGWSEVNCDDVLFSDFSVEFTCVNSWSYFTDLSSGEIDTWFWDFDIDDGGLFISALQNPFFTYTETGIYSVSLAVTGGVTTHTNVREIEIKDNPLTKPGIYVENLTYTSLRSAPYYQWFVDGVPIAGAIGRSYNNSGDNPGNYQVLISNGECNIVSDPLFVTSSPVFDDAGKKEIRLYPNPAKDYIRIEGTVENEMEVVVELIDLQGKILEQFRIAGYTVNGTLIPLKGLISGIYILRITTDTDSKAFRFLKQ